jgi:hypothetical protein
MSFLSIALYAAREDIVIICYTHAAIDARINLPLPACFSCVLSVKDGMRVKVSLMRKKREFYWSCVPLVCKRCFMI